MIGMLHDDSTSDAGRAAVDDPGPRRLVVTDFAVATQQGARRNRNEDAAAQLGSVFVVADGMGGLSAGDEAARVAAAFVARNWYGQSLPAAESVLGANAEVRRLGAMVDARIGSTLTACRVHKDQIVIAHVGDSRLYRFRSGAVDLLTRDHNVRNELMDQGLVPAEVDVGAPLRALTSHLGMPDRDLTIDVRAMTLRAGDRLVLCTDGVHEHRRHHELAEAAVGTAAEAARRLTEPVGADDATAMVIDIGRLQ